MFAFSKFALASVAVLGLMGTSEAFVPGGMLPARVSSATRRAAVSPSMQMQLNKARVQKLVDSKDLSDLFVGNEQWRQKQMSKDPNFFTKSAEGQQPRYLWIGCSDARVAANEIVGCEPGELFVHRNVANLVVNNDNSLQSVFQYAVEYLHVEHIIVCAHYDCSGVSASMERIDLASPLEEWVCNIRDVYRLHKEELDGIRDFEKRKRRLVELNAQEQALNVYKTAVVQRRRVYTHMKEGLAQPKVHAMVFDPKTGLIRRLSTFNAGEEIANLHELYDLYDMEGAKEQWAGVSEYPKRPNTVRKLFNRLPPTASMSDKSALPADTAVPTGAPTEEEENEQQLLSRPTSASE